MTRLAVIGLGSVACKGLLPTLVPGFGRPAPFLDFGMSSGGEVAVVCDIDATRLAETAASVPGAAATVDWREAVAAPSLDAVVIATPPGDHARIALAALERGQHVFMEKPVSVVPGEVDAIRDAAVRQGRIVMVHHPWRYQRHARTMAAALRLHMREIDRVSLRFHHAGPAAWSPAGRWYFDENFGLSLADLGPHTLDLLDFFRLGLPLHARARCSGSPRKHRAQAEILLRGGLRAAVDVGWTAPGLPSLPSFTVCASGRWGTIAASLAGPHKGVWATARPLDAEAVSAMTPRDRARAAWRPLTPLPPLGDGGPLQDFLRCIRSGTRPVTDVTRIYPWLQLLAGLVKPAMGGR